MKDRNLGKLVSLIHWFDATVENLASRRASLLLVTKRPALHSAYLHSSPTGLLSPLFCLLHPGLGHQHDKVCYQTRASSFKTYRGLSGAILSISAFLPLCSRVSNESSAILSHAICIPCMAESMVACIVCSCYHASRGDLHLFAIEE